MTQPAFDRTLLDDFVDYLRGFDLLGRGVPSPRRVLNTRARRFSYRDEEALLKLRGLWLGRNEVGPQELLVAMLADARPLLQRDADPILRRASVFDYRAIALLLESAKHAPSGERGADVYERRSVMSGAKEVVIQFEGMFPAGVPVVNPLVGLARRERERGCSCVDPRDRAHVLEEFERLSRTLWHLCTTVDPEILRARLLLLPDSGAAELELLRAHGDLIGLDGVDAGREGEGPVPERAKGPKVLA